MELIHQKRTKGADMTCAMDWTYLGGLRDCHHCTTLLGQDSWVPDLARRNVSGEPQLQCKDLWHAGYGKIAVVPTTNLAYGDDAGRKVKNRTGYTSELIAEHHGADYEQIIVSGGQRRRRPWSSVCQSLHGRVGCHGTNDSEENITSHDGDVSTKGTQVR